MFSSKTDLHETPADFFMALHQRYGFTIDVCALPFNAKLSRYFSPQVDGLAQYWGGERVWCNPPYGRGVGKWVERCATASAGAQAAWNLYAPACPELAVMLLPARTDTIWFQDLIIPFARVHFLRGRLKFNGAESGAPFPSVIAIFDSGARPPAGADGWVKTFSE